jgi:hypothetical protein
MSAKIAFDKEFILFAVLVLVAGVLFNFSPGKFPADDGFFYLQIAHNIAAGYGSTFHAITNTNGYHPLWLLLCTAASFINWLNKGFLIHIVWFIQIALFLMAIWFFRRFEDATAVRLPLGEAFLAFVFIGLGTLYLSEAHLNLFVFTVFLLFVVRFNREHTVGWFTLGIISGLLMLARLDNFFVAGSVLAAALFADRTKRVQDALMLILGGTILVGPYLLYNFVTFGHIVPISGAVKSTFPHAHSFTLDFFGKLAGLACAGYLLLLWTIFKERPHRWVIVALNVGNLMHLAYYAWFQIGTAQWYWVSEYLSVALLLNDCFQYAADRLRLPILRPPARYLLVVLLLLPALALSYLKLTTNFSLLNTVFKGVPLIEEETDPVEDFAKYLTAQLPDSAAVMVYDAPGKLAYYSDLRIFPSDGLVNDFAYNDYIVANGIVSFMHRHRIQYVLTYYSDQENFAHRQGYLELVKHGDSVTITVFSPLYKVKCGELHLGIEDLVLTRVSPLLTWQQTYPLVALWRIPTERDTSEEYVTAELTVLSQP